MKIIDDFLPPEYQDEIEKVMLGGDFPWYFNKGTVLENNYDSGQFTHAFIREGNITSSFFPLILPMLNTLKDDKFFSNANVIRVKSNLNYQNFKFTDEQHYPLHTDYDKNGTDFITCIYYVSNSDGDTVFFNDDETEQTNSVSPKKGRLVVFNGKTYHAGKPPKKYETRCVININFIGAN